MMDTQFVHYIIYTLKAMHTLVYLPSTCGLLKEKLFFIRIFKISVFEVECIGDVSE